jgi:hypothetical protein
VNDDDKPVESPIVNQMRATRWANQPPGAEEAYEASCLAWEQMTPEQVWGPAGDPTKTITRKDQP